MTNKQLILVKRPVGMPEADTWELRQQEVPQLKEGELLIQNHYISLDPAMRGWMNATRSYIAPIELGDVMRAGSIGKVIQSKNPRHRTFVGLTHRRWPDPLLPVRHSPTPQMPCRRGLPQRARWLRMSAGWQCERQEDQPNR